MRFLLYLRDGRWRFGMKKSYLSLYKSGEAEIFEKKSRFIALVEPIEAEEEALAILEKVRKKYWDARHHCYAYVCGEHFEIQRCSDDGEPSGTAGKPILDVIMGREIHNILIIVVRYFGGTLLGTGGLVRAYSLAAREGVADSIIARMCPGKRIKIHTDYNTIGKVLYELGQRNIEQEESAYTDVICLTVTVPVEEYESFEKKITEISAGKTIIEVVEALYFAKVE